MELILVSHLLHGIVNGTGVFGYLGNRYEHYHLSSYANDRNINMYDALLEDYELEPRFKDNLWKFCELAQTIYNLKETTEVLGRGGSHYANNPCKNIIINKEEVARINNVVLPSLFNAIADLLPNDDVLHKIKKDLNG